MAGTAASIDLKRLSVTERFALIDEIWKSILDEEPTQLSDAQKAELQRRIAKYEDDPDAGITWEQFIAELRSEQ